MQTLLFFPLMISQGLNLDVLCLLSFFPAPSGHLTQSWLYPEGHSPSPLWVLTWNPWLLPPSKPHYSPIQPQNVPRAQLQPSTHLSRAVSRGTWMPSMGENASEESPNTTPDLQQLRSPSTWWVGYILPIKSSEHHLCSHLPHSSLPLLLFSSPSHLSSSTKRLPSSANPASAEIISEVAELFFEFQSKQFKDINGISGSGTCTSLFAVQMVLPLLCLQPRGLETSLPAMNCKCWVEGGELGTVGVLSCKLEIPDWRGNCRP